MNDSDQTKNEIAILLFLIDNYAMIDGKYHRDLKSERKLLILEEELGSSSKKKEAPQALIEILRKYGSFRGVPFANQPPEALDNFIASGKLRMEKHISENKAKLLKREKEIEAATLGNRANCDERPSFPIRHGTSQKQEDAPYRFSSDVVLHALSVNTPRLSLIFEKNKKISPAFVAQELGVSKQEAKRLLDEATEAGEFKRTVNGWYEKLDD